MGNFKSCRGLIFFFLMTAFRMTRGSVITTEPPRVEGSDDGLPEAASDAGMGEVGLPGFLGAAAQLGEQQGIRNMGGGGLKERWYVFWRGSWMTSQKRFSWCLAWAG